MRIIEAADEQAALDGAQEETLTWEDLHLDETEVVEEVV